MTYRQISRLFTYRNMDSLRLGRLLAPAIRHKKLTINVVQQIDDLDDKDEGDVQIQCQCSSHIRGHHVDCDRRSLLQLEAQVGVEEYVDTHKISADEFRCVDAFEDLLFAEVSDVRLDVGVDVEFVAIDFRVRCDVFVVEGQLIGTVRPWCIGNTRVVRVFLTRLRASARSGVFGERHS